LYTCWLATGGSLTNSTSWSFDGNGWHEGSGYAVTGACTTSDHRRLTVVCGTVSAVTSVYVVNRGFESVLPATIESGWMSSLFGVSRSSVRKVRLWLRETGIDSSNTTKIRVDVYADWRAASIRGTKYVARQPNVATGGITAHFWDNDTTYDNLVFRKRRPFWSKVDIDVPSCEVFKLKFTATSNIEVLGFQFFSSDRNTTAQDAG
jgi:hypothetical protein